MIKQSKGITLIALVITIIILLILAGVAIAKLEGNNGLIDKVQQSKESQIEAEMKEQLILALNDLQLEKSGKATLDDIKQELINEEIKDYECIITEDASIAGKKVTISKGGITVEYIIDEKLNITEMEEKTETELADYVTDGMILYLDGINNTIDGHDNNETSTWYDLSPSKNNATLYNCTVSENGIIFNGTKSSYATLPESGFGNSNKSTIEVVTNAMNNGPVYVDNCNISHRALVLYTNKRVATWAGTGNNTCYMHETNLDLFNKTHAYSILYDEEDYNKNVVYIDSQKTTQISTKGGVSNTISYPQIGKRYYKDATTWLYFKGTIYSIRVYNRHLNENELLHNYNVDKARFGLE